MDDLHVALHLDGCRSKQSKETSTGTVVATVSAQKGTLL